VKQSTPREKTVELPNQLQVREDRLNLLVISAWHIMQPASENASAPAVTEAA